MLSFFKFLALFPILTGLILFLGEYLPKQKITSVIEKMIRDTDGEDPTDYYLFAAGHRILANAETYDSFEAGDSVILYVAPVLSEVKRLQHVGKEGKIYKTGIYHSGIVTACLPFLFLTTLVIFFLKKKGDGGIYFWVLVNVIAAIIILEAMSY